MNLIGNTFFKVLSKQVTLLNINVITIIVSAVWGLISAYCFNNTTFVVIGMVVAIIFRSVVADITLGQLILVKNLKYELHDIALAIIFVIAANRMNSIIAFVIFVCAFLLRVFFLRKSISFSNGKLNIHI